MHNLPNIITISRIICIPLLAFLIISDSDLHIFIFTLYIVAAISDFFDGYLARKLNATSEFGKMLDPIADKLLVGILLLAMAASQYLDIFGLICAILILFREIFVSGLREYFAGRLNLPVTFAAKLKTTTQLIAIGFYLAANIWAILTPFALLLLILATLLTLYTGLIYFYQGVKFIKEEEEK